MDTKPMAHDRSQLKIGILGALALICGYVFGYFFYTVMPGGADAKTWLFFSSAVIWLIMLILVTFLIPKKQVGGAIVVGSAIALSIGSRVPINVITLTGFILAVVWLIAGYVRVYREVANAVEIHFARIALRACQTFITAVALFWAFILVSSIQANGLSIPREAVLGPLQGAEPIVATMIPGFSLKSSIHDVVEDMVREKLGKNVPDAVIEEAVGGVLQNARESLEMSIQGEELVGDVLYAILTDKLRSLSPGEQTVALAGIGVLIFLITKGFGVIFAYIAIACAFLVYHGALAVGLMRIESVETRKEIIVL